MSKSSKAAEKEARKSRADAAAAEAAKQKRLSEGTAAINSAFSQFGDSFYDKLTKAYIDLYYPDITKQYSDAANQTNAWAADRGLLNSSALSKVFGNLTDQQAKARQAVSSKAVDYANTVRGNVSDAQSELTSLLQGGADANTVARMAAARAGNIASSAPSYSPIGNIFSDILSTLGTGVAAGQKATDNARIQQILFGDKTGSSSVTYQ